MGTIQSLYLLLQPRKILATKVALSTQTGQFFSKNGPKMFTFTYVHSTYAHTHAIHTADELSLSVCSLGVYNTTTFLLLLDHNYKFYDFATWPQLLWLHCYYVWYGIAYSAKLQIWWWTLLSSLLQYTTTTPTPSVIISQVHICCSSYCNTNHLEAPPRIHNHIITLNSTTER